tara:strand:+ start:50 stop:733 length:684 start_codon:yes stop_codon:yes gene_type:complete
MARAPTQKEIAAFIVGHGITDFVTGGRLSLIERNALWKVLKKLGPPAVSTTGRLAGQAAMAVPRVASTALRGARFVTMRHPYIAAAVVTYEVVKNRDQIAQLAREGWEVVAPAAEAIYDIAEPTGVYDVTPAARLPFTSKRKASKYNKAVSRAMKAVKASTKGGKKGTISKPKSVFKTVSKAVSKVNRGVKVGNTGITGIAARAARKILGKKKKPKKGKATFTYRKN